MNFSGIFKTLKHDGFKENLSKVYLMTFRVCKQLVVIFKRQVTPVNGMLILTSKSSLEHDN